MNIDHLRKKFSNETVCRQFFESVIWKDGRRCPHCGHAKSCRLHGAHLRAGVYECYRCKRQFTVTTKTPLHSTKLPLWKWLQAMYYIVNSSKGISSVLLARWLGVTQPTAWKLGHCIRAMMDQGCQTAAILNGIVELDEKYLGAKPRFEHGLKHKRGRGTAKQCILIAVQRQGSVRAAPVKSNQVRELSPLINSWVSRQAHLMSDEHTAYRSIAEGYAAHSTVNHQSKEYARGPVHNNTAESFGALIERAKQGVFHYMSHKHTCRYLDEIRFRWDHRLPEEKLTRAGIKKIIMRPLPVMDLLRAVLSQTVGKVLQRTPEGGIVDKEYSLVPNLQPSFCR